MPTTFSARVLWLNLSKLFNETILHRNLIRGGYHGLLAFYSGAQRGSPKVADTCRAALRPFPRAL